MNGLSKEMARMIISTKGEIRIYNRDFSPILEYNSVIENLYERFSEIVAVGPVNRDDLLVRRRFTAYTETFGVNFDKHSEISDIFDMIRLGTPTEESFSNRGIMLGLELSHNIVATVGDTVEVISPSILIPTPLGMIPRTERFRVVGIFSSGLPEFDRLYSFINFSSSKNFKRHNGADYLEVKTNIKDFDFRRLVHQIEREFPDLTAQHWEIFDKTLYQAIKIEKIALFAVMTIILILASFNIAGNFIRTVTEKKEEIALLKTIGMNKKDIFTFFVTMGVVIGVPAILVADILAFALLYFQQTYEFIQIPVPGFPFTAVPVDLNLNRFINYSILALALSIAGTLYPAYRTMKINIVDVLKDNEN
jgi:lipoprotein-releasing system permease protein